MYSEAVNENDRERSAAESGMQALAAFLSLPNKEVGERIDAIRDQRGLSRVELAKALGIGENHFGKIVRGEREFRISRIAAAISVLKIHVEELGVQVE